MRLIDADKLDVYQMRFRSALELQDYLSTQETISEKVGKWIIHETQNDRYDDMICPFCRKSYTVDAYRIDDIGFTAEDFKFCPNCGAYMRGEEE